MHGARKREEIIAKHGISINGINQKGVTVFYEKSDDVNGLLRTDHGKRLFRNGK